MTIKPRQAAPSLDVTLLDGKSWRLADAKPAAFQLIVFYRGLHCSVCKSYLGELDKKLADFSERGVDVIAISADSLDRAKQAKADWGLAALMLGCELPITAARDWELFVSSAIREGEPPLFTEPGLFLIKRDGTLFYASRSNAPWGRPSFDQILRCIDIVTERKTPARGEA